MAFIPKNKVKFLSTKGKELYNPKTQKEYIGDYIQYGIKFFVGNNIANLGDELKLIDQVSKNLDASKTSQIYHVLNKSHYNKAKQRKQPPNSKPIPTEEDYDKGYFYRYFAKRKNSPTNLYEINKTTYKELIQGKYDSVLYLPGKILWSLEDETINNINVLKSEKNYPGIGYLFGNILEYIFFARDMEAGTDSGTENLIAQEGELVYLDGTPFPAGGKYHIHPSKGLMEGGKHTSESHSRLRYTNPGSSTQTTSNVTPQPSQPSMNTYSPTTPQINISSSPNLGGGGGGGGSY